MIRHLLLAPLKVELSHIEESLASFCASETFPHPRLCATWFPGLQLLTAIGGHGKAQFAITSQHLIDCFPSTELLICAGAAGAIDDCVSPFDVVVGSATTEHDYVLKFSKRPQPYFKNCSFVTPNSFSTTNFRIHHGVIASGDEDVVSLSRAREIKEATDALCVAWEGAGAARAAQFNKIDFVELRGITDVADGLASSHFEANLPLAMKNLVQVIENGLTRRMHPTFTRSGSFGG